jgi:hypothetical protein
MMRANSDDAPRMTVRQRCVLWLLSAVERWVIPLLPRGASRNQLRARIDRAQARFHSRVHDHDVRR